MMFKPVQWLSAAALLVTFSVPGWAQPELVGGEVQINQNRESRLLDPVAAFSPSGSSLVVWENELRGLVGRAFDRNGTPISEERVLVANDALPPIPGRGEVTVRKDPALLYLPGGEFLLFWTEEKQLMVLDHFYWDFDILDQDVYGQRFDAAGVPQGARFQINAVTAGLQRRPKAAVKTGGLVVVWENAQTERDSTAVHARLLARRGQPTSEELRVDSGRAAEVWNTAVAANAAGDFLVTWESDHADGPDILARAYDRFGTAAGAEITVNTITLGRQRRPAVLAGRDGDFLVAWQGYLKGTDYHGINGQIVSPAGAKIGSEVRISKGVGEVQIAPALALLPSGDFVVAWMDWIRTIPVGVYAVLVDSAGRTLGEEIKISQERLFPQYRISVAANAHGEILATWEGRMDRKRAIAGRFLLAD